MKKNKWYLLISLLAVFSMVLVSCGGGAATTQAEAPAADDAAAEEPAMDEAMADEAAAEPVTIDVWFHSGKGEEREVLDAQVTDFNASHTDVQVNAILLPEGSYNDQVNAAALSGDLPCLLDFDGPFLYNYAWAGYMRPLDDLVPADVKADFLPSIIAQGTYGGKLYSLGTFDSGLAIWGNKAYLDEAGVRIPTSIDDAWTMDEFMSALESLNALDQVEYALDLKLNYGPDDEWNTYGFSPILQSFGGDLIDRTDYQSADGVLNGPKSVAAMEWFQSLFTDGYANPSPAGDDDFYGSKIAALSWVGHWMYGPHTEGLGDDLVLIPMPILGEKATTGMGSWNWGITSTCENPEAAYAFLDYLIEPEQILRMTNANGAVPARKSAIAQSELYGEGGKLNIFVQQLENGVAVERPTTPAYPVITSAYRTAIWNIIAGADVQSELDTAVQTIDQDIQDNNGYPLPE
ncbi:MAG: multiple sugar transport system substrate-binding protein [Chloroflexota bacterium]|nr:multiple sugar transport system substrate-binding protein [Chloroflexota bacterium]